MNCRTAVAAATGEDNKDEEVDNKPTDSEGKVMEVLTTPNMEEALTMYSLVRSCVCENNNYINVPWLIAV